MSKKILVDAAQPQETRVVLLGEDNRIEDLDFELETGNKTIKGNIYIAKVVRIEPSLQAVFVDYGHDKQGFLSFSEIHPSYFNIPKEEKKEIFEVLFDTTVDFGATATDKIEEESVNWHKKYSVQQVIKNKQLLLVQVEKDERGNKCAAMSTYISLVGCYCILMPNTSGKIGVSRKINDTSARSKLKEIAENLGVTDEMSLVIRTAGETKTKKDIKKDYEYLLDLWTKINQDVKDLTEPGIVYEEACLVKRTMRDMYEDDVDEIIVDGREAYKIAKNFIKNIAPSRGKNVQEYTGDNGTLFQNYGIESQLNTIYSPRVDLFSGGYIVINHTEALIAIDINSGKSTREKNVEETALKTNLEAVDEICKQLIIRNLSGIIVVDFIDMYSERNKSKVEKAMKSRLSKDRAKSQASKLSDLGLMEISRQMLKPSIVQVKSGLCPHCAGLGYLQTSDAVVMRAIRSLQFEVNTKNLSSIEIKTTANVAMNLLNNYRATLLNIEKISNVSVMVSVDSSMVDCKYEFVKSFSEVNISESSENTPDVKDVVVQEVLINNVQKGKINTNNSSHNNLPPVEIKPDFKGKTHERKFNKKGVPQTKALEKKESVLEVIYTDDVRQNVNGKPLDANSNKEIEPLTKVAEGLPVAGRKNFDKPKKSFKSSFVSKPPVFQDFEIIRDNDSMPNLDNFGDTVNFRSVTADVAIDKPRFENTKTTPLPNVHKKPLNRKGGFIKSKPLNVPEAIKESAPQVKKNPEATRKNTPDVKVESVKDDKILPVEKNVVAKKHIKASPKKSLPHPNVELLQNKKVEKIDINKTVRSEVSKKRKESDKTGN